MSKLRSCRCVALAIAGASLWLSAPLLAQRANYQIFTDPQRRFSVEYPKDWSWVIVQGAGEPIVAMTQQRREAAIVVERVRLRQALAGDAVTDDFADIEATVLKENQPMATDVMPSISSGNGRRLIVIDYSRPGGAVTQRVRQYSYPVGRDLYRVTCMAVGERFMQYEATFETVVQSMKTAEELAAQAPAQPPAQPPGR